MRILLIGNFAPPYEEENLHNLSLLKKLEEDGHHCSVINISENPSHDKRFIDAKSIPVFVFKLLRRCLKKDIIHFSTKGYLRLGLLKLMISILLGKLLRTKTIVTFHSELFSILGQMRSPFGGTQTLYTSFFLADKIIFSDKDTYDVATIYQKKSNMELIPSFVYIPNGIFKERDLVSQKLEDKKKVIIFQNVKYPSFLFELLNDLTSHHPFHSEMSVVISLSEKPTSKLQRVIEETGKEFFDNLIFIEPDDINKTLIAYSRADIILRPSSCEGKTHFESFVISAKKTLHSNNYVYFPSSLLFVKEGNTSEMCVHIINTILSIEAGLLHESQAGDSYTRILKIYEE